MKTGIVLEGGALRTIFSSGVCDALLEGGLLPDYVIGVSAGIAYGVSYVSGQPRRNLKILTQYVNDKRYMGVSNLLKKDNQSYFGLEFTYETIADSKAFFEAHRLYLDIHLMLSGSERVEIASPAVLEQFDHQGDFYAYRGEGDYKLALSPGDFLVVFPNDAHRIKMCLERLAPVSRVVFRVRIL